MRRCSRAHRVSGRSDLLENFRRIFIRVRQSQEAAYRFMSIMAGNRPGFEEATRALFAGHRDRFDQLIAPWPKDVRHHARKLAADAVDAQPPQRGS